MSRAPGPNPRRCCQEHHSSEECPVMRADLYREGVEAKCDALRRSGFWAPDPIVKPAGWLRNFSEADEQLLASILLDNFVFYSEVASNRLLLAAYNRFEDDVLLGRIPSSSSPADFLEDLVFTPVQGERPGPTDSGMLLCRKLRDLAEIDEDRFLSPPQALAEARCGRAVVFLDDFIGTGDQLLETWERPQDNTSNPSFKAVHDALGFPAFCLALVATKASLDRLAIEAPGVTVVATHIVDESYSVQQLVAPSLLPPLVDCADQLRSFLERHAAPLQVEGFMETGTYRIFGYHDLGLLLAFQHSIPDSTLPIFWAEGGPDWVKLVKPQ